MLRKVAGHLTYANVMATIAVFIALGGGAYALTIPRNAVGPKQIKKNAVGASELRSGAVRSADVRDGALRAADFRAGELPAGARGPQGPKGDTGAPPPVEAPKTPVLLNGWEMYDQDGNGVADKPARYWKDPFGVVHLEGAVHKDTAADATMFTLPPGYRPVGYRSFAVLTTGENDFDEQIGYLQIDQAGLVYTGGGKNGYFALDGVTFKAER